VALVAIGYGVFGALGAVLALIIVQFGITVIPLRTLITRGKVKLDLPVKEIISFATPTTIALIALFSFVSSDVILVKHFFSAKDAGLYGGLSLVGKVIFYFTIPVPVVMFPLLVRRHTLNQSYKKLFYMALLLVTIPSIFISGFYFLFPEFTINIFLGGRDYLQIAPYLGIYGIFLTIYSINNTFLNYFLSIGKTKSAFIVLFFAVLQILGIWLFHESFTQVITVSILTSIALLISLAVFFRKSV
jgi:O-antigen/teichoic acid export membrane protein